MPNAVTKRLVFYCPGYDAESDSRYRRLLVIGLGQLRRRFGIQRTIGPIETDDAVPSLRWKIVASRETWRTETVYEMLSWQDLVRRDLGRTWFDRIPVLVACMLVAVRDRVIVNLFRLDWHFACLVVYPWVSLIALFIAAPLIGYIIACLIGLAVPLTPAVKAVATLAFAAA